MLLAPLRWALRIAFLILAAIVLYFGVTLVQVWLTSRQYDPHPAGAILVMGAAQYDCVPSPDLRARLDQAAQLYRQGYAPLIMVTGNKEPGDKCTESQSGAMYLEEIHGVPKSAILEAGGDDSYENIADAQPAAPGAQRQGGAGHHRPVPRGPLHGHRLDLALSPSPTPTQTSPITGWSTVPYFLKEAVGVGWGGSSATTTWSGCTTRDQPVEWSSEVAGRSVVLKVIGRRSLPSASPRRGRRWHARRPAVAVADDAGHDAEVDLNVPVLTQSLGVVMSQCGLSVRVTRPRTAAVHSVTNQAGAPRRFGRPRPVMVTAAV